MADPDPYRQVIADLPTLARSIHCFRVADPPPVAQPRSRTKFTDEEKERIRDVRRQGACLRCRMLKIQCSNENPCQSCLQSAVKGSERKVLSFCYCVRTRFSDVNIFDSAEIAESSNSMQIESLMARMGSLLNRIAAPANFSLEDKTAFNDTLVSWLANPDFSLPNGSIVGLCCSNLLQLQFEDKALSDDGLVTEFRRFLLATSLVHGGWKGGKGELGRQDLCAAGHVSGYRLIKRLDRVLTPQFLAKCDRESCQVLFLLVLGTVLGVGYSSSLPMESPIFPSDPPLGADFQQSPTLWLAMKEHLCQMLAHHLIFLGSMLGIKMDTGLEQRIIDTAVNRWDKMESFVWADTVEAPRPPLFTLPRQLTTEWKPEPMMSSTEEQNPPYWEDQDPPLMPMETDRPPTLVPISFPELPHFQPDRFEKWSENPQSYLDMTDEPENVFSGEVVSSPIMGSRPDHHWRSNSTPLPRREPFQGHRPKRETKRRSMWVVRSYDAGPGRGQVNVHARLRNRRQIDNFGVFV